MMLGRRMTWAFGIGLICLTSAMSAEGQGTPSPAFEVASVKPNKSGSVLDSIAFQKGGRFIARNVTLRELIRAAYEVQNRQLVDGPTWIASERFDIVAKAEGEAPPTPMMIRKLLADRFQLTTHNEARELPLYVLVMARTDRRLGPQLRESQVDCKAVQAAAQEQAETALPKPGERQNCDSFIGFAPRFLAGGVSMVQLALSLSRHVNRIVMDKTGLTGIFDFELQWTPDGLPARAPGTAADQPIRLNGTDVDPNGPSIFTAMQEQLGLKLESTRGPIEVHVIDSVAQPTPD
jgi:uncharacterized protein (TIGR03435 family)